MEKRLYISELYYFYMELLTERQRQVFEMHFVNDLSFSEIAEELSVSRQAVNDILHKAEKALMWYEEKLRLYERHSDAKKIADAVSERVGRLAVEGIIPNEVAAEITALSGDVLFCFKS